MLERLEFSYNLLGDGCTSTLATIVSKLPQLTHIGLSSCDITKNFFQQHRIALSDALQGKNICQNKDWVFNEEYQNLCKGVYRNLVLL